MNGSFLLGYSALVLAVQHSFGKKTGLRLKSLLSAAYVKLI